MTRNVENLIPERFRRRLHPVDGALDCVYPSLVMGWLYCPQCVPHVPEVGLRRGSQVVSAAQTFERPDTPMGLGFSIRTSGLDADPSQESTHVYCLRHPSLALARIATPEESETLAVCTTAAVGAAGVFGEVLWVTDLARSSSVLVCVSSCQADMIAREVALEGSVAEDAATASPRTFHLELPLPIFLDSGVETVVELRHPTSLALLHQSLLRGPPRGSVRLDPVPLEDIGENKAELKWVLREWIRELGDALTGDWSASSVDERRAGQIQSLILRRLESCDGIPTSGSDRQMEPGRDSRLADLIRVVTALPRDGVRRSVPLTPATIGLALAPASGGPHALTALEAQYSTDVMGVGRPASQAEFVRRLASFAEWLSPLREAPQLIPRGHVSLLISQLSDRGEIGHDSIRVGHSSRGVTPVAAMGIGVTSVPRRAVELLGMGHHASGLGFNARVTADLLARTGVDVVVRDIDPHSLRLMDPAGLDISPIAVRDPDSIALLHLPIDRVLDFRLRRPEVWRRDRVVAFLMWETSKLPSELHADLDAVDELWTASEYSAAVLQASTDRLVTNVGHAVDVDDVREIDRRLLAITPDGFVVHFSFDANSTIARKNPTAAVRAFERAFAGDRNAFLVLKVRNWGTCEAMARAGVPEAVEFMRAISNNAQVRLVAREVPRPVALGLIALSNCYLSLHRSEGFGYTIAEAMALGVPVVTTEYSGNTDYCSAETAWLSDFELVPVRVGEYFNRGVAGEWARPSTESASSLLLEVRENGTSDRRVAAAKALVRSKYSSPSIAARYQSALLGSDLTNSR